jgi:hypothetical protein
MVSIIIAIYLRLHLNNTSKRHIIRHLLHFIHFIIHLMHALHNEDEKHSPSYQTIINYGVQNGLKRKDEINIF